MEETNDTIKYFSCTYTPYYEGICGCKAEAPHIVLDRDDASPPGRKLKSVLL
jgi:hypothetical protein